MYRSLRVVFAFLLALALPLQGYAAASMAACGPAHAAGHHEVASGSHPAHGAHAVLGKLTKSKCSVCAACCAAMAMPVAWLEFDAASPAQSFAPSSPTADAAFLTAGLERPPRIPSA